jgi:hypothetical protein
MADLPVRVRRKRRRTLAVRRLHHTSQPELQVVAAARLAISGTVPIRAMITAVQAEADAQRRYVG